MSDRTTYDIYHPDMVLVLRSRAILGLKPDESGIPNREEHISLLHIVRIEELQAQESNS